MTPDEIKKRMPFEPAPNSWDAFWLKEIAYQFALLNERENRIYSEIAEARKNE